MLPAIILLTLLTRGYARPLGDDPITAFSLQAFNDNNDVWIMRHVNSGSGSGLLELHKQATVISYAQVIESKLIVDSHEVVLPEQQTAQVVTALSDGSKVFSIDGGGWINVEGSGEGGE